MVEDLYDIAEFQAILTGKSATPEQLAQYGLEADAERFGSGFRVSPNERQDIWARYYTSVTGRLPEGDWMQEIPDLILDRFANNTDNPNEMRSFYTPWYRELSARLNGEGNGRGYRSTQPVDTEPTPPTRISTPFYVPTGQSLFVPNEVGLTINPNATLHTPLAQAVLRTPKDVENAVSVLRSAGSRKSPVLQNLQTSLQKAYAVRTSGMSVEDIEQLPASYWSDKTNFPEGWTSQLIADVRVEDTWVTRKGKSVGGAFPGLQVDGVYVPTYQNEKTGAIKAQRLVVTNKEGGNAHLNYKAQLTNPYERATVTGEELSLYGNTLDVISSVRADMREAVANGDTARAEELRNQIAAIEDPRKTGVLGKALRNVNTGLSGKETIGGNLLGQPGVAENVLRQGKYDAPPTEYSLQQINSMRRKALEGVTDKQARVAIEERYANMVRSHNQAGKKVHDIDDVPTSETPSEDDAIHNRLRELHATRTGDVMEKIRGSRVALDPQVTEWNNARRRHDIIKGLDPYRPHELPKGELNPEDGSAYAQVFGEVYGDPRIIPNRPREMNEAVADVAWGDSVKSTQYVSDAPERVTREPLLHKPEAMVRQEAITSLTASDPSAWMERDMANSVVRSGRVTPGWIKRWQEQNPAGLVAAQTVQYNSARDSVKQYRSSAAKQVNDVTVSPILPEETKGYFRDAIWNRFAQKNASARAELGLGADNQAMPPEPDAPRFGNYSPSSIPEEPPMPSDWTPAPRSAAAADAPANAPVSDVGEAPAMDEGYWASIMGGNASGNAPMPGVPSSSGMDGGEPPVTPPATPVADGDDPIRRARSMLEGNARFQKEYSNWIGGTDIEGFQDWLGELGPGMREAWDTVTTDHFAAKQALGSGTSSQFSQMLQGNPEWSARHSAVNAARKAASINATPSAQAVQREAISESRNASRAANTSAAAQTNSPRHGAQRTRKPVEKPTADQLTQTRSAAEKSQSWIRKNAPEFERDFLGNTGRSKEFDEFKSGKRGFQQHWKNITADVRMSERAGVPSLLDTWEPGEPIENNVAGSGTASIPADTTPPVSATVTASSNGSGAGVAASTSTPVDFDDINAAFDMSEPSEEEDLPANFWDKQPTAQQVTAQEARAERQAKQAAAQERMTNADPFKDRALPADTRSALLMKRAEKALRIVRQNKDFMKKYAHSASNRSTLAFGDFLADQDEQFQDAYGILVTEQVDAVRYSRNAMMNNIVNDTMPPYQAGSSVADPDGEGGPEIEGPHEFGGKRQRISPVARNIMRQHGIRMSEVQSVDGEVMKADLERVTGESFTPNTPNSSYKYAGAQAQVKRTSTERRMESAGRQASSPEMDGFNDFWSDVDSAAAKEYAERTQNTMPLSNRELTEGMSRARIGMSNANLSVFEGKTHEMYGSYKPFNRSRPGLGGVFVNKDGEITIDSEMTKKADGLYQGAVEAAFGAGGLEGMSGRESAATLHSRITETINKVSDNYLKEVLEQTNDPGLAKSQSNKLRNLMSGMLYEGDQALKSEFGVGSIREVNTASTRAHGSSLLDHLKADPKLAERLEEMGLSPTDAMNGPRRVVTAGDRAYAIGASDNAGGTGGGWSDKVRSLYSTMFGHAMMAQFMGQMAWKQTGGAVIDEANQYATNQYGYFGLESFGAGEAGGATAYAARMETAANRRGELAYQQYGFLNEMGWAYGNNVTGRFANDAKMALGVGAVAGVGSWAVGAGAGMGMAAATGLGMTVGLGAAAAVGVPALLGSAYNVATDQDSYTGWSPKNMLAAFYTMPTMSDEIGLTEMGIRKRDTDFAGEMRRTGWSIGGWIGIGSMQEKYAQDAYGMSSEQLAVMTGTDRNKAAWLTEGRDEQSIEFRELTRRIQDSTPLKEDIIQKELSGIQVAFGGLDTAEKRSASEYLINRSVDLGVSTSEILSGVGNMAQQQGVLIGTPEFQRMALNYASMDAQQQQKAVGQSSRDYQRYGQWTQYIEGGNSAAYALYQQLDSPNVSMSSAVTSALANAQQTGTNLTPDVQQQIGTMLTGMTPMQANATVRFASTMANAGAGSFVDALGSTSQLVTSGAMSEQRIQNLASFNMYEWSDFARENPDMPNSGAWMQYEETGLKDGTTHLAGSGLLTFARQNMLNNTRLTDQQTLNAMGVGVGDSQMQNALLTGGFWAAEQLHADRQFGFQMAGIGIGFAQLAENRTHLWGSGTWDNPDRSSSWGISDRIDTMQYQSQMAGFATSLKKLDLSHQYEEQNQQATEQRWQFNNDYQRWNQSFNYQTSLMQRDWTQQDWQYQASMRSMQFDWQMEDFDEGIRRSSGYERSQLIKKRDRAVQTNNMENTQIETTQDRQKILWEREDQRYKKSIEYADQIAKLDQEGFARSKQQREELYQIERADLLRRKKEAEELRELQLQLQKEQRRHQQEMLKFQEQSLGIQAAAAYEQKKYQDDMRKLQQTQELQSGTTQGLINRSGQLRQVYYDLIWIADQLIARKNALDAAASTNMNTTGR